MDRALVVMVLLVILRCKTIYKITIFENHLAMIGAWCSRYTTCIL